MTAPTISPTLPRRGPGIPAHAALPTGLVWAAGFGAWTALALLSTTQAAMSMAYRGQPFDWRIQLAWRAVDWYSCAAFVPAFLWLVRRAPLERETWRRRLPAYAAATASATLAKYALLVPV